MLYHTPGIVTIATGSIVNKSYQLTTGSKQLSNYII